MSTVKLQGWKYCCQLLNGGLDLTQSSTKPRWHRKSSQVIGTTNSCSSCFWHGEFSPSIGSLPSTLTSSLWFAYHFFELGIGKLWHHDFLFVSSLLLNYYTCSEEREPDAWKTRNHKTSEEMDLTTQLSALVGTSFILYLATKPNHDELMEECSDPKQLNGCLRYSSYHRKRLRHSQSSVSACSQHPPLLFSSESSITSQASDSDSTMVS